MMSKYKWLQQFILQNGGSCVKLTSVKFLKGLYFVFLFEFQVIICQKSSVG